jgi:hypothetical protein
LLSGIVSTFSGWRRRLSSHLAIKRAMARERVMRCSEYRGEAVCRPALVHLRPGNAVAFVELGQWPAVSTGCFG